MPIEQEFATCPVLFECEREICAEHSMAAHVAPIHVRGDCCTANSDRTKAIAWLELVRVSSCELVRSAVRSHESVVEPSNEFGSM